MVVRVRLCWRQIKTHPIIIVFIPLFFALLVLAIIGGYKFNWAWTGFTGNSESYKTLYDWLQLLFVPIALTGFGFYLSYRERKAAERHADKERQEEERRSEYEQKAAERRAEEELKLEQQRAQTEREVAVDNQCEEALQAYLNEMSELLLHENLLKSDPQQEVRKIARVQTITTLRRVDAGRKVIILQFLREANLIIREIKDNYLGDDSIISLENADLQGVNLNRAFLLITNLTRTNLQRANLHLAVLDGSNLVEADLSEADLSESSLTTANLLNANLSGAKLDGADLCGADLTGAIVTEDQLAKAFSNDGTIMPDGYTRE
jgi:uncharacterized protein YjbI with pentapeptide repeats